MAHPEHLIAKFMDGLGVSYGVERSFKMYLGGVCEQRFLLSVGAGALGSQACAGLFGLVRSLNIPAEYEEALRVGLAAAGIVHIGFEGDRGAQICKVYLEFLADFDIDKNDAQLLYRAYKWDFSNPDRRAVTEYFCRPGMSESAIIDRFQVVYPQPETTAMLAVTKALLAKACSRVPAPDLFFMDVVEPASPRLSFDLNFYDTRLRLSDVYCEMEQAAALLDVPSVDWEPLYSRHKSEPLGHVSGGLSRDAVPFLTVYFGAKDISECQGEALCLS